MVKTFLTSGLSYLLLAIASNEAEAAGAAPPNPPSLLRGEFHSDGGVRNDFVAGGVRNDYVAGGEFHSGGVRQEYVGGEFQSGGVRKDHVGGEFQSAGGVRNDYGCIASAGFSWCASLSTCLRPFESTCPPVHDVLQPQPQPAGPVVDQYGCRPAAGEIFCAYTRQCERPGGCYAGGPVIIPGSDIDNYGCRAADGHSYCHSSKTCELYGDCLNPIIVGDDRDQYGCLGSAGYSWCDTFKECIRTFDTTCPPPTAGTPGGEIDQWGCRASAGYSYCPSSDTCERYYDCRDHTQPVGNDLDEYGCAPAAGYTWCPSRYQCIRAWETECFVPGLPGGDIDQYGCQPSTGYSYCAYTRQCERPGDCQEGLLCPAVYEPVNCGGYDFSNLCEAEREGYYPQQCTSSIGGHTGGPHNPTSCGFVYEPVFCDGYQYSNLCLAGIAGYADYQCILDGGDVTPGCSTVHDPVCCEGQQYSNSCFAEIAGYYGPSTNLCAVGECRVFVPVQPVRRPVQPVYVEPIRPVQPVYVEPVRRPIQPVYVEPVRPVQPVRPVEPVFVGCDQVYEPVCCDGYDFPNFCEAQQVNPGHSANNCLIGECRPVEIVPVRPVNPVRPLEPVFVGCDQVYEPVCCDGNTFSNFCEAEQVYGYSPNTCVIGECRPVKNKPVVGIPAGPAVGVVCDSVYDPVCCDGNQFPNLCEAERANPVDGGRSCIIGECQVY